jgi:hypothetical protein
VPDASERRTLAACAFIASLLLFPLGGKLNSVAQLFRDRIAALSALTLAAVLLLFHIVMTRREAAAAPKPPAPASEAPAPAAGKDSPESTTERTEPTEESQTEVSS